MNIKLIETYERDRRECRERMEEAAENKDWDEYDFLEEMLCELNYQISAERSRI